MTMRDGCDDDFDSSGGVSNTVTIVTTDTERKGTEMKNVQIPYDLFLALLQYHLMMDDDYEAEIRYGLEQKLEAMVRHELYAKYKTALTPEEREEARQRYLDERGIPQSYRWTTSPWEL